MAGYLHNSQGLQIGTLVESSGTKLLDIMRDLDKDLVISIDFPTTALPLVADLQVDIEGVVHEKIQRYS